MKVILKGEGKNDRTGLTNLTYPYPNINCFAKAKQIIFSVN